MTGEQGLGAALILAGFGLAGGCSRPATTTTLITNEQLQNAGYSSYWTTELPLPVDDRIRAVHLVDDNLYVTTEQGFILAVSPEIGEVRWFAKISRPVDQVFQPAHAEVHGGAGPVVLVTSTELIVADRYSGDLWLRERLEFPPSSGAAADVARVYLGSTTGQVYSYIWNNRINRLVESWRVDVGSTVAASPVLGPRGELVFGARNGSVYCCESGTKIGLWEFRTDGPILARPHVDESGVYVASMDRSVYRVDPVTGVQRWRCRLPQPLSESPLVAGGTLFQYSDDDGLYAIDLERGTVLWRCEGGRHLVSRGDKEVGVLTSYGQLQILDAKTGQERHSFDVPSIDFVASNAKDATMILLRRDGRAVCAVPQDRPYLRRDQAIAARSALTLPPAARQRRPALLDPLLAPEPEDTTPVDPLMSTTGSPPLSTSGPISPERP